MKFIIICVILLTFLSCDKKDNSDKIKSEDNIEITQNIYSYEYYKHRIEVATDKEKEKSIEFWEKAQIEHRTNENYELSVSLYENAIKLYPKSNYYFEMGNAFLDLKKYEKSIEAFEMAAKCPTDKYSRIYYNIACAASLNSDIKKSYKYLNLALQYGYKNHNHIMEDPDLRNLRNDDGFLIFALENSLNFKYNKQVFIGKWEETSSAASGDGKTFRFHDDKKVEYVRSSMSCDDRLLSKTGIWEYDDNNLVITFFEKKMLVGGELVEGEMSCGSDYDIVGGEIEIVKLEEPEIIINEEVKISIENKSPFPKMIIDGKPYWKKSNNYR